mgnify:CR=1 FL=1
MKISKRQLKRIIKEEKNKLLKEMQSSRIPHDIQDTIDSWLYHSEENLNGRLSELDRDWHRTPEILDAIQVALDIMKDNVEVWRNQ